MWRCVAYICGDCVHDSVLGQPELDSDLAKPAAASDAKSAPPDVYMQRLVHSGMIITVWSYRWRLVYVELLLDPGKELCGSSAIPLSNSQIYDAPSIELAYAWPPAPQAAL
jgi:hypothetical protein